MDIRSDGQTEKTVTNLVRVRVPSGYWNKFEYWMASMGCRNRSEGFRTLMQAVVDAHDQPTEN